MTDLVHIDLADAKAIAQNIAENLQYDFEKVLEIEGDDHEEDDAQFWQAILTRLNTAIEHANS